MALLQETLRSTDRMHRRGMPMSQEVLLHLLQQCVKFKDLAAARQVHCLVISSTTDASPLLLGYLNRLFSFCGSLLESALNFCKVSEPSVYTWQAIISAHAVTGENLKSLELFCKMQLDRVKPNVFVYPFILKACGSMGWLMQGRIIHDQIMRSGFESGLLVANALVDMYARCASLQEARAVFDRVHGADVVSWSSMIAGYAQFGFGHLALELFERMQQENIKPNKITILCVLKACASIQALGQAKFFHEQVKGTELESDIDIGNALVDMYVKCGSMEDAHREFEALEYRTEESWNALIAGYNSGGNAVLAMELFYRMLEVGGMPDSFAFTCVLTACAKEGAFDEGKLIYKQVTNIGLESHSFIGNSLINMYAKAGSLEDARYIFDTLPDKDAVSWSSMIAGYTQHGLGFVALDLFEKMQRLNVDPDYITFSCILKACSSVGGFELGKMVHIRAITQHLESDLVIGNTLIDMYANCGSLEDALKVFDKLESPDIVSSGTILAAFAQEGEGIQAFHFLEKMQAKGIKPDNVAFSSVLIACRSNGLVEYVKLIHGQITRSGLLIDVIIGNALIDIYTRCNCIEEARKVFDSLPSRDLLSWNLMISAFAESSHDLAVFELFKKMQKTGVNPDEVTFLSVLKTCGTVGAIGQVNLVHHQIIDAGCESIVVIANTVVDMYAKCGSVEDARAIFDRLQKRNIVSWGAIIAGHAQQGDCERATQCLKDMRQEGLKPNAAILAAMLSACTHAGLGKEGHMYFTMMKEELSVSPAVEHYNCIIDLFGRAGLLNAAKRVLDTMPVAPNTTGWISLLNASRMYNDAALGKQCFDEIVKLDPSFSSGYILMSNLYADANRWEDLQKLKELRKCHSTWKKPGSAWVEVDNKVHEFIVGDKTHPTINEMDVFLQRIWRSITGKGYVAYLDPKALLVMKHCP